MPELVFSGLGVLSAIGQGKDAFASALMEGRHEFAVMQRPGRQRDSAYLGAEIGEIKPVPTISPQIWRAASLSAQAALTVLEEAWNEARLSEVDPWRLGLVVGGSNIQQRELVRLQEASRENSEFLRPTYALSFMDTDLCGFCTAHFGIHGLAYTVGGASASGQMAIIQAAQAVLTGQVDICVALGALMDLSHWECRALRAVGAMGSDRFQAMPHRACRPFDRDHDGFIFGECCGAVVVESAECCARRGLQPYAVLQGWGIAIDGNRYPNPSLEGEVRVVQNALRHAEWLAEHVDYVNPHGTGSLVGDQTELNALKACGLNNGYLNTTKSLTGHGLSAAGAVEVIATLLQMKAGRLHPSHNLENPINDSFRWVRQQPVEHTIKRALSLSLGFGGINTAVCLSNPEIG